MNAGQQVATGDSELQVMMAIHSYVELQRTPLGGPGPSDWDFAIEVATQHEPKCTSYAPYLATYVRCYGGGYGAPLILDLNEYSSRFAAGRILGGDFINNVLQNEVPTTLPSDCHQLLEDSIDVPCW